MDNLSEIQKQILEALEKQERLKLVNIHLENLKSKHKTDLEKLKDYDRLLDKELKDIEKLDSIGVKSLFYKVLGSKEEQLEKERQDFLEASLKYKELKKAIELDSYEIDILEKKLHELPMVHKEIDRLKSTREKEILSRGDSTLSKELKKILDSQELCVMLQQNINDAVEEGEKSEKMLEVVLSYLKKARDWGQWDMGGSRQANYSKSRAIDKAMSQLGKAQYQLNRFAAELKDLGKSNLNFKIDGLQFNKFTDFFFDNLISDWIIQQKIKSTISNVEATLDQVKRLLLSLEKERHACSKKLESLSVQRDQLLIS